MTCFPIFGPPQPFRPTRDPKLMLFSDSYGVQRIISIKNFMKPEYFLNSHYFSHYLTSIKIFLDNIFLGSGFDNFKYLCQW